MTAERVGRVIKSVGGFHTVTFPTGETCTVVARGRLKRKGTILVGDRVRVADVEGGDGVVEDVLERRSELVRPPVANVELVVVVMSCADPPPNLDLLDRILLQASIEGIHPVIAWNKTDLVDEEEAIELAAPFRTAGLPTVLTSVLRQAGISELAGALGDRISVLAGPSGVGKSSLLNAMAPEASLQTQDVSKKTQRGRHTTREVTLLPIPGGGWVADSPGFSTLGLGAVDPKRLPELYPEFHALAGTCRFSGCLHRQEPGCAVRAAVDEGRLDVGRYQRYQRILSEVEQSYERRY